MPDDVLPNDAELLEAHEALKRLRYRVHAHIDDIDSPAPRIVERVTVIQDDGTRREHFQETGGGLFSEQFLERLSRLAREVAENVRERLEEAQRRDLDSAR